MSSEPDHVQKMEKLLFAGLCALLAFAPLAFGTADPWSKAVLEAGSACLVILWCVIQSAKKLIVLQWTWMFAPILLFGAVALVQIVFGLSARMQSTHDETILYCAYAMLFFLATAVFQSERNQRKFVMIFSALGFLIAMFGIIQHMTSHGVLYWYRQPRQESSVFGPFFNHNHYAGWMEMVWPLALILALSEGQKTGVRMMAGFAAVVMGFSILLSSSRAGSASFVTQMLFLGTLSLAQRKSKQMRWAFASVFLASAMFLYWFGFSSVWDRYSPVQVNTELTTGRLAITQDALHIGAMKPILGWGLGTFPYIYPEYRSFYTNLFVNQAHNDYAQIWAETGAAGTIAMVWFVFLLLRAGMRGVRRGAIWKQNVNARLAAFTGCLGILVHSFADFNLHIAANAAMFYVLCAIATLPKTEVNVKEFPARHHELNDELMETSVPG